MGTFKRELLEKSQMEFLNTSHCRTVVISAENAGRFADDFFLEKKLLKKIQIELLEVFEVELLKECLVESKKCAILINATDAAPTSGA